MTNPFGPQRRVEFYTKLVQMLAASDNDCVSRQTIILRQDRQIRAGHFTQEKLNIPRPSRVSR